MVLMEIATALGVSITALVIYLRNAGLGELYSYFLFRPYPLIKKKIEIDDNNGTRYKTITLTFAYPKGKYLPVEVEKGDDNGIISRTSSTNGQKRNGISKKRSTFTDNNNGGRASKKQK